MLYYVRVLYMYIYIKGVYIKSNKLNYFIIYNIKDKN